MKRIKVGIAVLCIVAIAAGVWGVTAGRGQGGGTADLEHSMETLNGLLLSADGMLEEHYKKYLGQYAGQYYQGDTLVLDMEQVSEEARRVSLEQSANIQVPAAESGLYAIGFDYKCTGDNILQTSISMKVNGEIPYQELGHLFFADTWKSGEVQHDRYQNESIAMPEKVSEWRFTYLRDTSFLQNAPLLVYLEQGLNELELSANEGSVVIGNVYLASAESLEVPKDQEGAAEGTKYIEIEAEDMDYRSLVNIRTEASFDASVTPYDPYVRRQNVIAENSYRVGGTGMDYMVTVEEDGYYYFAFDYMQSEKDNFSVYRNLYIDGQIPSASYENIAFPYTRKYQRNKIEVPVYLTAGEHRLTLEVSLEPYGDAVTIIGGIVGQINDLSLSINKIIGGNNNKYRDFDLEEYGLNIEMDLNEWADMLEQVYLAIAEGDKYGTENGQIKLLDTAVKNLRKLAARPNELPQNINQFSYGDSSVRQYLSTVSENLSFGDMSLDKIYIYQKGAQLPKRKGALEKAVLNIEHVLASFVQDDYVPEYNQGDALEVWVNRPRQYLEMIQRMVDTDFTEKTGIKVNLSIVPDQQKLILANASGKSPDTAIGIGSGFVYDLALRNALVDLRQFDNFKEVGRRFAPGMLIPGACDDGIYAIPETFNFYVLFYRTDVLEKLNLQVPDNMDEVRKLLPELSRMGLEYYTHAAAPVKTSFAVTAPFVLQNGGAIFAEDGLRVRLDTEEVIGGLKILTENFTVYDMDYEILNFYQSFRDGRTPIGVSEYGTYNLLTNAAPELNGCWDIALYPGIVREDGTVDRSTSGAGESCVIFDSSEKQEQAWAFLDWWMSDEVQKEFSVTLQSTLGNEYMWNSANVNAIAAAPWSAKHKAVILEQIGWTNEIAKVPGSYMIERELGNIVVNVVTQDVSLRTAIDNAQKRINAEFSRKLEEFGYIDSKGNVVKELVIPDKELIEEWLE